MTFKRLTFAISTIALSIATAKSQLVINELMQSNIDCVMDDLNDFPDSWVELYNPSTSPVSLKNYKIGLTDDEGTAWTLPDEVIGPKRYVLVCCDKEAKGLHTDFRLESGKGGAVYLFSDGKISDSLTDIPKQPAPNIAYGRRTDGSSDFGYLTLPTPSSANCGKIAKGMLGEPIFSEAGKVTTAQEAFSLVLSMPEGTPEGTEIRYTMNGSEPTETSSPYRAPIYISAKSSKTVKAKLFCDGYISPRSVTQSYIYMSHKVTLPVVSISTDPKYLNDSKIGIYVDGSYKAGKKNYEYNWRRPINFEYFEGEGDESAINQLCEARIQGGASRGAQMKSLALYAHKRFGEKRFEYEFFPDQRAGETRFKSIILRNAGNDFDYLYMRDAIIQRHMASHTDLDWQAWSPVVVYINGTYKGMLNIRERSNEDNIYTNYDGLEDIDMIENWSSVKAGDKTNWDAFTAFYEEHGHTMAEYDEWMDCKEFINLMVMNLYYDNQDFPGNNIVMWRPREEGGRWRFVAKDTDFGLGLYDHPSDYNDIAWIYDPNYDGSRNWANGYEHTRLFRRLMEDKDFSREFIDHCAIYMGDFLNGKSTWETWEPMYEKTKTEYPHHRKLINQWWPNYSDEVSKAKRWAEARTNNFYKHLANYYKLGNPCTLLVNPDISDEELQQVEVRVNGISLTKGKMDGKFFAGRSLTLDGTPVDGKYVKGWRITASLNNGKTDVNEVAGSSCSMIMPDCRSLVVSAILGDSSDAIDDIAAARKWHFHKLSDRLSLSGVEEGTHIYLYNMSGMMTHHIVADGMGQSIDLNPNQVYILRIGAESIKIQ